MDIYPTKAQFLRGEEASLRLETCGAAVLKVVIRLSRLGETVRELRLHDVTADTNIPLGSFDESFASYGVDARVETEGGSFELHTAFDVTDEPRRCLRYGFLSDFTREDAGNGARGLALQMPYKHGPVLRLVVPGTTPSFRLRTTIRT